MTVKRAESPAKPIGVDQFDWDIVAFVVKWAPYGGPKVDDVMPTFGMNSEELQQRFIEIVTALAGSESLRVTRRQHELLRRAVELLPPEIRAARRG